MSAAEGKSQQNNSLTIGRRCAARGEPLGAPRRGGRRRRRRRRHLRVTCKYRSVLFLLSTERVRGAIKELEGVRPRGPVIGPLGLGHHEEGGAEGPHDLIEKTPTAEAYIM